MKKLLVVAFAALSLTTFGAWEKIGSVRLADVDSLVKGVSRLGELTGNQMLGMMASQTVGQLPPIAFFGPGRAGAAMSYILFLDGEKLSGEMSEALGSLEYAVLYPVSVTKAAFIAAHPGAVETNGLVRVCEASDDDGDADDESDDEEGKACDGDVRYVAFSADGKWAAMSDKPEQAKAALAEVKIAEKKMDGDLAKILIDPKGWVVIARAMEEAAKGEEMSESERNQVRGYAAIFRQISAWVAGLRVNDSGLDIRFMGRPVKGSEVSKIGLKAISADAWKNVPAEALVTSIVAEDSGSHSFDLDKFIAVLKKHGIELPFLTITKPAANYSVLTFDIQGVVDYAKSVSNLCDKVDGKALLEDIGAMVECRPALKGPACGMSLVIKGFKPVVDMKTRLATTLPEIKDKPINACTIASYYSMLKGVVPALLTNLEPDERTMFEPMLATLPPEGKSGLAYATWCDKGSYLGILRVGADEFKGLAACFSAITAMQMQKSMKAAQRLPGGSKAKPRKSTKAK